MWSTPDLWQGNISSFEPDHNKQSRHQLHNVYGHQVRIWKLGTEEICAIVLAVLFCQKPVGCIYRVCFWAFILSHWSLFILSPARYWLNVASSLSRSQVMSVPQLWFFFQSCFDYFWSSHLHLNFKISLLMSIKEYRAFDWDCTAHVHQFGKNPRLDNVEFSYPQTWDASIYLVPLCFHLSEFCSFPHVSLILYFVRFIPEYSANVNGIVFLFQIAHIRCCYVGWKLTFAC